jgi:lipase chaperone LimK
VKRLAAGAAVVVALGAATIWWASEGNPGRAARASGTPAAMDGRPGPSVIPLVGSPGAGTATDPFLSPDLRLRLEALLLEAGRAESPAALKQRLASLVPAHFPPAWAARALAIAERYVDYRVALAELSAPADARDPRLLRAALEARGRLRDRHFAPEESEALFGSEAALDRFTLARLEIEANPQLTTAQKQAALREAESEFPAPEREQRAMATVHMAVAAQTASYDAQGTSDAQRHAERRLLHGEAVAERLGRLDQDERDWQQRLSRYAAAQAQAMPDGLARLRDELFSPAEQLRLDAALALRERAAAAR